MARRVKARGISKDRVYTIKMAARLIGVSEATFRKWPKAGLRIIADRRPYLVRGDDLMDFLRHREAARKAPMAKGQFYCMRCKGPCNPLPESTKFHPTTQLTGRLRAVCERCGCNVGRFCKVSDAQNNSHELCAT